MPLDERSTQLNHPPVLQVDGDHVVAVIQQNLGHWAAKVALYIVGVPAAGDVVLDGVQHQRRHVDPGHAFFDHCVHPMQLAHGDAFHGQQPRFATLALFHLAFDNRPQALILDAVGRFLSEAKQTHTKGNPDQQRRDERHFVDAPTVVLQGGRIHQQPGDLPRVFRGHVHRHHRAHGQTANEHLCVAPLDLYEGLAHAFIPVAPAGGLQVAVIAAVPRQRRHVHRAVAGLGQAFSDLAQFSRSAGQAVDQQDPDRTITENESGITFTEVDLCTVHRLVARTSNCSSSFRPSSISG